MLDLGRFPYINNGATVTDKIELTAANAGDATIVTALDFSVKYKSASDVDTTIKAGEATAKLYDNSTSALVKSDANATELLILKGSESEILDATTINGETLTVGKTYTLRVEVKVGDKTTSKDIAVVVKPHADDIANVQADRADVDVTPATGETLTTVESPVTLVQPATPKSAIVWTSDNAAITISGTTVTVNRPAYGKGNADVKITATMTSGGYSETKVFNLVVLEADPTAAQQRLIDVNKATTAAEMEAALQALIDNSELTPGSWTGLVAAQRETVAQTVLNARPAGGFADITAVQTAFDAAL